MISFSLTNLARSRTANTDWSLPELHLDPARAAGSRLVVKEKGLVLV